jgi:hypothetical protein
MNRVKYKSVNYQDDPSSFDIVMEQQSTTKYSLQKLRIIPRS